MLKITSKCYNRAHNHLDPSMEALIFIRGRPPATLAAGRGCAPSPGPASAGPASTSAVGGGVGACSASAPLLPDAAAASAGSAGGSLGELRSFAGASFSRQTATSRLPRCTFQTHEVLVEISQHQSNIIVKAARGAGDLLSPAAASKFTLIFFFTA